MLSVRRRRRLSSISARSTSRRAPFQPSLVAMTQSSGMGDRALPIVSSLCPPAYVWAVSMRSTPAATASFTNVTFSGSSSAGSSRGRSERPRCHPARGVHKLALLCKTATQRRQARHCCREWITPKNSEVDRQIALPWVPVAFSGGRGARLRPFADPRKLQGDRVCAPHARSKPRRSRRLSGAARRSSGPARPRPRVPAATA
jgi:hypothetical protein